MGGNFLTFSRIGWLVGVAVLVLITNIAASVVYMVIYGHLIDPGHDQAYYDAHIQVAAPYCSIVAGVPLMFLAGWWVGHWWRGEFAVKSALVVWLAYAVIDVAIILAAGAASSVSILVAVSLMTKLAAAYLGSLYTIKSRNA